MNEQESTYVKSIQVENIRLQRELETYKSAVNNVEEIINCPDYDSLVIQKWPDGYYMSLGEGSEGYIDWSAGTTEPNKTILDLLHRLGTMIP